MSGSVRASRHGVCAGFTLIEMLVATTIMLAVTAGVFAVIAPTRMAFQAQPEAADMQQRMRAAVDTLRNDLLAAGAGPTAPSTVRGPLLRFVAPVMPYRFGRDRGDPASGVFYRTNAISILSVPFTTAEGRITAARGAGGAIEVDVAPNCGAGPIPDRLCGFQRDMRALLVTAAGVFDTATITSVAGLTLQLDANVGPAAFGDGSATIAEIAMHTYYLKADPQTNTFQLMHYDGGVADFPVIDNVVALRFAYYGDPMPPALLPGVDLNDRAAGPWTTYGPRPPPPMRDDLNDAWPAGENCVFAVVDGAHVSRVGALVANAGSLALLPPALLTDGPWCPDDASPWRFDADLLRVRQVRVMLRVQVGSAALRGPAGVLFTRGGTADAGRWIPDQEVEFDVSPRNLNSGR